jgi:hypothetical protein
MYNLICTYVNGLFYREACPGFMSPLSNTCMRVFEDAVDEMINVINDTNVISNNTMMYSYHGAINLMHVCITYAVEVFISSLTWKVARLCKV